MRVLLAEDNHQMRESVSAMLRKLENCTVEECADGKEAFDQLQSGESFDMIVTDNHMPRMTGEDLVKQAREELGLTNVPVIMFSGGERPRFLNLWFVRKREHNFAEGVRELEQAVAFIRQRHLKR